MVPMRAKERAEGLYPVLSTAVAKWQPAEPWGRVARGGELQREGKRAVKGWGATCGCHGEQEVAGAGPEWRAALRRWTEEAGHDIEHDRVRRPYIDSRK